MDLGLLEGMLWAIWGVCRLWTAPAVESWVGQASHHTIFNVPFSVIGMQVKCMTVLKQEGLFHLQGLNHQ